VIGITSINQITRTADEELVEKFGLDYETYMQEVPRLNIIIGIFRKLKRRD
jgi:protein-S-isoprenylcysteine O-methyltransferase Ste14